MRYMHFFKKIFGNSKNDANTQSHSDGGKGIESAKEDHDQGHPSGVENKNVCEFCEIPSTKRE